VRVRLPIFSGSPLVGVRVLYVLVDRSLASLVILRWKEEEEEEEETMQEVEIEGDKCCITCA
jgi:hypothetical protein